MKKTLVIHPADPSTDFLKIIYKDRGFTEITESFDSENLKQLMKEHERIVMLGHGYHHGLLHYMQTVIDASFVPILREKELVGIWCFAKSFFDHHGLSGFHTDMFISEPIEASVMGVLASDESIELSNATFAKLLRNNLFHPNCLQRVKRSYLKLNLEVSTYNGLRFFQRSSGDPTTECQIPSLGDLLKQFKI